MDQANDQSAVDDQIAAAINETAAAAVADDDQPLVAPPDAPAGDPPADAKPADAKPAEEKAARSDYVITTDTLENALTQVQDIVADIRKKLAHA